ncbi:LysR family transcriptional regulator [Nocardia abscessus]|uniref:LysR family transcriptional regulator n=1 Tax=Nocardia abscessus TaxID=120957 RepID=UPI001895B34B|nr:LysR family transcriptional regulator [Nocardia abscessus]MBF6339203.1 LysR family transcriptional regulator [Nocardia abscessus]
MQWQVDIFSLRLFLSAIEERQIGLAAAREHIAASTATKRIQALETMIGLPLLDRTRTGVVPTEAGAVLARYARKMLADLDDLRSEMVALTVGLEDRLVVAAAHSVIIDLLAPAVGLFLNERPFVEFSLSEVDNKEVVRQLEAGECDIGVFASVGEPKCAAAELALLGSEPLVAVLPRDHPLAAAGSVRFRELAAEGLIATQTTAAIYREHGAQPGDLRHVVRTGEVALGMVRAGLGATVVPRRMAGQAADSEMLLRTLDEEWAVRRINAATATRKAGTPTVAAFVACLMRQISQLSV